MTKHIWKWVLAASAVVFLAPASAVVAGDQVPVKGNLTIFPDPTVAGQGLITGIVSHLGAVSGSATHQMNPDSTLSDSFTLMAANGDCLTGAGTVYFISNPPGVLNFIEIIMITGGSGRFANATGSAMGQGQVSLHTGVVQESVTGTISSPGSLP
jgi:hypothetical protein